MVQDQETIFAEGFGYADKENDVQATEKTVYYLESVSKVLTATAFMNLVEKGLIDIDLPINTYIPEFSIISPFGPYVPITSKTLMIHYAGLPHKFIVESKLEPQSLKDLISKAKTMCLIALPHTEHLYSNMGITILGYIVEKVTNTPYSDHMEKELFDPLQMETAQCTNWFLSSALKTYGAQGYNNGKPISKKPIWGTPAGGITASVLDMSNFIKMLLSDGSFAGKRILKPETLEKMFTVQNGSLPHTGTANQGLVWFVRNSDLQGEKKIVSHNGGGTGFVSYLALLPDYNLGVIVCSNTENKGNEVKEIAYEALKLALSITKKHR